ncbi:MAG: hypothetical protein JMDDDDMK_00757 [Acidobacteria bacterium]|nr:hypothetical protein [Acidobacteriota bacterium]
MYCPNCAATIDGSKFCRSCGANVSLVPQAMTGQLPQAPEPEDWRGRKRHRRGKKEPSIDGAATEFFSGIGFLLAAIFVCFYFPAGVTWGWTFLFPAFALIGGGIGQYLRLKEQRQQLSFNRPVAYQPPAQASALSAPTTSELVKPPSVTEQTTRHLESSRPRE